MKIIKKLKRFINTFKVKEHKIQWKSIIEIPTEHWANNHAISPKYLVKCGYDNEGNPILGYSNYSFVTNKWIDCFNATEDGIHEVIEWTDVKF